MNSVDARSPVTRRQFTVTAWGVLASLAFSEARGGAEAGGVDDGRIAARPKAGVKTSQSGTQPLGLAEGRDGALQIPATAAGTPLPLLVLLHGAGGSGAGMLRRVANAAATAGIAVLAPDSRGSTWDAIRGDFDQDVTFVNRALERVFQAVNVDPARIAVGGFSDGASYAVSLGLINGDLFGRVAAFSPGFVIERAAHGKPRFFISHGTADTILPIDRCGRPIAAALRRQRYEVTFREFDGGHAVPPDIADQAMKWLAVAQ
jgi:phospholipase/carboxylesterase